MKIREKYNSWIAKLIFIRKRDKTRHRAITLYPFIFYTHDPVQTQRYHEFAHIHQIDRLGFWKFYISYLKEKSYRGNKYEVEAREWAVSKDQIALLEREYPQLKDRA